MSGGFPLQSGQLFRGTLAALLLCAADRVPRTALELAERAGTRPSGTAVLARPDRAEIALARLVALGHLQEAPTAARGYTRTATGDIEAARLGRPPGRAQPRLHRSHTGESRRIRDLLVAFTSLHTAHLAAALGITRHRVGIHLSRLAEQGEIERIQGHYWPEYRLTAAGHAVQAQPRRTAFHDRRPLQARGAA